MSIIYDALKKVQKNINNGSSAQIATTPPAKTKAKIRPFLIYILLICLGLALGNYAYIFFSRSKKIVQPITPPVKQVTATPAPNAESNANSLPITLEPTLVLSGVFFEQGDGYALINNKIVRVGDEISRAKVKEITMGGVELEYAGKTIKLLSPS